MRPSLVQPESARPDHFRNRMAGEDRGRQAFAGRFGGDGLRAVFAELGHFPMAVRIRPSAAGTVEAVLLIHFKQRLQAALDPHFADAEMSRLIDGH